MKRSIDDPQGYIAKLQPIYIELFRTAHAIVGNLELAEYVLKKAIYEAFLRRGEWRERMSFREGLSQTVRMVALIELQNILSVGSFDSDWALPELDPESLAPEQKLIYARLARESLELNRVLMLYYGCSLRISQIAQVIGKRPSQVRDMLYMFRSRLERSRLRFGEAKHAMEDSLERLLISMLQMPGDEVPDSGMVIRAFERDADAAPKARRSAGRIVAVVLCSLGAVACALLFWLVAVLMEPGSVPQQDSAPAYEQDVQVNPTVH